LRKENPGAGERARRVSRIVVVVVVAVAG